MLTIKAIKERGRGRGREESEGEREKKRESLGIMRFIHCSQPTMTQ